ncbi:Cdc6/Cdc18 family protein [Halomontanus rarus]|uniref:Cdc6/Cdc18 family protein n=1 Tax=Halomontanus rarus TaxID=3034020 RepID=UPI0023E89FFB|nr:Cdc6/Cdc18 family protein [Halovivax sp. TS33]
MITNPEVLEEGFTPSELVKRSGEITHLSSILEPILKDQPVEGAFIYGPSGTGKTCTSKYLVERLEHVVWGPDVDDPPTVETHHIDCWGGTYTSMAQDVLDGYDDSVVYHQNTPKHELSSLLAETITDPYIVVLDEADQLDSDRILYELHEHPKVTMLLIANDYNEFYKHLESRVESRVTTYESVPFEKYQAHEIASILSDRVRAATEGDVITEEQLFDIADVANNDARIAIGILKNALRTAEREGASRVGRDHILDVVPETKREVLAVTYSRLTRDQRILYQILVEDGEQSIGEIHETYADRVDEPYGQKTVKGYLKKMKHYYLVDWDGEKRGRKYFATTERLYKQPVTE